MNASEISPAAGGRVDADEPEPEPGEPPADEPHSPGPQVILVLQTEDADPPAEGWLDAMLARVLALADPPPGSTVNVVVVGDDEMAGLHERYRGETGTTDVLAFDLSVEAGGNAIEGEIVICRDEAARQAARRGHDTRTELLLYAVHGLLHLLGEDDHDPDAYERMHRREDELLRAVGVGPVFEPEGRSDEDSPGGGAA